MKTRRGKGINLNTLQLLSLPSPTCLTNRFLWMRLFTPLWKRTKHKPEHSITNDGYNWSTKTSETTALVVWIRQKNPRFHSSFLKEGEKHLSIPSLATSSYFLGSLMIAALMMFKKILFCLFIFDWELGTM